MNVDVKKPEPKEEVVATNDQENLDGQSSPMETCVIDGIEFKACSSATFDDSDLDGLSLGTQINVPLPPEPQKKNLYKNGPSVLTKKDQAKQKRKEAGLKERKKRNKKAKKVLEDSSDDEESGAEAVCDEESAAAVTGGDEESAPAADPDPQPTGTSRKGGHPPLKPFAPH